MGRQVDRLVTQSFEPRLIRPQHRKSGEKQADQETFDHMRIIIEAVPQSQMRPPYNEEGALGDWFYDASGNLVIRTVGSNVTDDETLLVALHELVEAILCRKAGIPQEAVDSFDAAFEGDGEPGDAPDSPYRHQHRQAMIIEHILADWLGVAGYGLIE